MNVVEYKRLSVLVSNSMMALVDHIYLIEKLLELPCSTKREENSSLL